MRNRIPFTIRSCASIVLIVLMGCQGAREIRDIVHPEQRQITYRAPEALPYEPIPLTSAPRTVSYEVNGEEDLRLSLDEAIRIALQNAEVIRVIGGVSASSSGRTIYDPGIANTAIDQARGRFDPTISINNTLSENQQPSGVFIPGPPGAAIRSTTTDGYVLDGSLNDTNALGGTGSLRFGVTHTEIDPLLAPLNPQLSSFTELSYVQPLLQGGGIEANIAPIFIASIETERSFFQFKGGMQELVRGVIDGYWSLVFARTNEWDRDEEVAQAQFAYDRQLARRNRGFADLADTAQTRVALTNFRANLVTAKATVLQREAALLNLLGISPTEVGELIPTTPPYEDRIAFQWQELVSLAERSRPDLVELKLIIAADSQRVLVSQNNAQARLDTVASYRWDGLEGRTPTGPRIGTGTGDNTDWSLGVNFSVPIGLRQARAGVRRQEMIVTRDRANLRQGLHSASHQLALSLRNVDQFYEQYVAFTDARDAARENIGAQQGAAANGLAIPLVVLQAITDWGNAVSSQAQALTQYNTELATLELQTGTILEAHGIRFIEERYQFAGPLPCQDECYPTDIRPTENEPHYPNGEEPSEKAFDLEDPLEGYLKKQLPGPVQSDKPTLPPREDFDPDKLLRDLEPKELEPLRLEPPRADDARLPFKLMRLE